MNQIFYIFSTLQVEYQLILAGRTSLSTEYELQLLNSDNLKLNSVSRQSHKTSCQRWCVLSKFNPRSHKCECFESQVRTLDFEDEVFALERDIVYLYDRKLRYFSS